jgi:hypothetical protein
MPRLPLLLLVLALVPSSTFAQRGDGYAGFQGPTIKISDASDQSR